MWDQLRTFLKPLEHDWSMHGTKGIRGGGGAQFFFLEFFFLDRLEIFPVFTVGKLMQPIRRLLKINQIIMYYDAKKFASLRYFDKWFM